MSTLPGVQLIEVESRLLMRYAPTAGRATLDDDALRDLLSESGYGDWFIQDEALAAFAKRANTGESNFEVPVAERRDAQLTLEISPDALHAWVTVTPARGGKMLDMDAVIQTLADARVFFGLDEPALNRVCMAQEGGRAEVATGTPPKHGENTRFEMLVDITRDRTPKVDASGAVDFRELGDIPMVSAGQGLMRRHPATLGTPGRNIHAEVLQPIPGKDEPFPTGLAGAKLDDNDPNLMVAEVKGQPVKVGNGVMVEQVIRFQGASMSTGNISFDGTVHIDGDVQQGMQVRATGDIVVTGTVDGGHLNAGANVRVGGGVIAQSVVHGGDTVAVRFVENSKIEAGVTIAVDDMALQSQLQAGNQILVGVKSSQRGRMVGGSARAMMRVSAPLMGDAASSVTEILVGVNPVLEAAFQNVTQQLDKQKQDEEGLNKVVQHLARISDKKETFERAQATLEQTRKTIKQLIGRKDDLDKQLALVSNACVEIGTGLAGSVDLAFGRNVRQLRRPYGCGSFSMENGLVLFTPKSGDKSEV